VPNKGNEADQPEPLGDSGLGAGGAAAAAGDADNGRPVRSLRVLPTPPPLPADEDWAEPALPLSLSPVPMVRPRPVPPPVVSAADYAFSSPATEAVVLGQLAEEIDDLYRRTVDTVSENKALAERCQSTLKKARGLLQTPEANPADVEALLERVRATLARADRSVMASRRYGPPLAGYSILWVVALLLLLVLDREAAGWLGRQTGRPDLSSLIDLAPYWACMLWGGMGAAASALYGLYRHFAQRDFDSEHKIGYLVQPVLGVVVGALVYLVVGALFFAIGEGQSYAASRITAAHPLALLSALAGFELRHAYRLLDGAARRLFRAPARTESGG
jgi:hypothetical protein